MGEDLETWCPTETIDRDVLMLESAERWLAKADDRPAFAFLFFFGTHFNYFYPERSARFAPAWDGKGGGLKALKELHFMHCPKCGLGMQEVKYKGVDVDVCFACGGVFLDKGELEHIAQKDETKGVMSAILNWLKPEAKT